MPAFTLNAPADSAAALLVQDGFGLNAPPPETSLEGNTTTIVSLRPPQYGVPLDARLDLLARQLPNGASTYIGLFSAMPDRAGRNGIEAAGSGYARVLHTDWRSYVFGGFVARRANTGEIRFAALTGDLTVVGWGAWNTAGTLVAYGLLRDEDLTARVWELAAADQPGWADGQLIVGVM